VGGALQEKNILGDLDQVLEWAGYAHDGDPTIDA
jgi:hypothetical protein